MQSCALFDTNIVIDALKGIDAANKEYQRYETVYISLISWIEVMVGTNNFDELMTRDFLQQHFIVLPITLPIAELAVKIRQQRRIKLPDALIQSTAQIYNTILVTRNSKDFPETEPNIRIPYQLLKSLP
jgi:predicted nucleic acid-binding protein